MCIGQDVLIDPLMADAEAPTDLQRARNLLRAPILMQPIFDQGSRCLPGFVTGLAYVCSTSSGALVWAIAALTSVALQLAANSGFVTPRRGQCRCGYDPFSTRHKSGIVVLGKLCVGS